MLRDARLYLIGEGTSEILRLFIAREALDPHLKATGITSIGDPVDFKKAFSFYLRWYPGLLRPGFRAPRDAALPPGLRGHLWYLENASRRLARDLFHMLVRHGQGLQRKQMVLARLVDVGVELFAVGAVLSRAAGQQAPSGAVDLADLFCRQARRRIGRLRRAVYCNDDRRVYDLSRKVLEGEFPWLEENILSTWKGSGEGGP
jgi:alkylation response protein AidB-like acyl-CoA dehydrogenase